MKNHLVFPVVCAGLLSCASVTSVPLTKDSLYRNDDAAEGFRYYLPKPYLLVTYVPAPPPTAVAPPTPVNVTPSGPSAAAPAAAPSAAASAAPAAPPAAGSQPTASDVGFQAQSPTYTVKLIYLPDYDHPSAVQMHPGAGVASIQLTLQDGWMLTNVSTNGDNTAAMTMLSSAFQALASVAGAGASGGASTAAKAAGGATPGASGAPGDPNVLKPGLYAFDYTGGEGRVTSICAVSYFDSSGAHKPSAADPLSCAAVQRPAPAPPAPPR